MELQLLDKASNAGDTPLLKTMNFIMLFKILGSTSLCLVLNPENSGGTRAPPPPSYPGAAPLELMSPALGTAIGTEVARYFSRLTKIHLVIMHCWARQSVLAKYLQFVKTSSPQSQFQAVESISTPRRYPCSG